MLLNRELNSELKNKIKLSIKKEFALNLKLIWGNSNRYFFKYSKLICKPNNYFIILEEKNNLVSIKELFPFFEMKKNEDFSNKLDDDLKEIINSWVKKISFIYKRNLQLSVPLDDGKELRKKFNEISKNL